MSKSKSLARDLSEECLARKRKRKRLIGFMNSFSQGKSGGDICFIEIAKRLNQYDKVVVTSKLGKKLCEDRGLTARFLVTTKERFFQRVVITYLTRIVNALRSTLVVKSGEIIYSTSDFLPDVIPAFWHKIRRPQAIWIQKIFHLIPRERTIPHYAQLISFSFIKRCADSIIVDNDLLVSELIRQGFCQDRIRVNHPGVDLEYVRNLGKQKEKRRDGVFLGRLHASKGIYDLVSIWKKVCTQVPKAKLGIIGDGTKETVERLEGLIEKEHLKDNIELLGYLEDKEAHSILASSKVFVFPSREEGFGIAICEALALGIPVIAYDLPAYESTFKKGIITVPLYNIESFADNTVQLLTDKARYKEQIEAGSEVVKRFTWDKSAENELGIILSLETRRGCTRHKRAQLDIRSNGRIWKK